MSTYDDASLITYPSGYKSGVIYSQKPTDGSGDLTFIRASTATRVNESGLIESVASGVPRIDFTGGGCGKLLIEPQRTNLVTYSDEFDNAYWTKTNTTITANNTTSPDGTTNADKIVEDANTASHNILKNFFVTGDYNAFIFLKKGERTSVRIDGSASQGLFINLENGDFSEIGTTNGVSVEDYGNGWYKCSLALTVAGLFQLRVFVTETYLGPLSYLGDGTSGIFAWGAQLELGSYPTSYIPTAGATATRLADVASQSGISTLIGQTEGTILVDVNVNEFLLGEIISIRPDVSNKIEIYTNPGGDIYLDILSSGVNIVKIATGLTNGRFKIGVGYKSGDTSFYLNGSLVSTNSSSVINFTSTLDSIGVSNRIDGSLNANIDFNSFQLMKTRVTDAELETLTTL